MFLIVSRPVFFFLLIAPVHLLICVTRGTLIEYPLSMIQTGLNAILYAHVCKYKYSKLAQGKKMPQTLDFSSINHSNNSAGVRTTFVKEMTTS